MTFDGTSRLRPLEILRGSSECDDRQVLAARLEADLQCDLRSWTTADQNARLGAWRTSRPTGTRLEARSAARGSAAEVNLVWRPRPEELVRTLDVVPATPQVDFVLEGAAPERNHNQSPGALGLDGPDQALNDGDASVLADSTESLPDPQAAAPAPEGLSDELLPLSAMT